MVKINFIILLLCLGTYNLSGQMTMVPDSIIFSGVVINTEDSHTLPNVTCRYGHNKGVLSDEDGRFLIKTYRGDTIRFTYVGFKPCVIVIPGSLIDKEYMVGVFMSPDTLLLSEALIMRRWGESRQQNVINARNNMSGVLRQALSPVNSMDADMNQRMMINDYAHSMAMKGLVDVKVGVGTQSVEAYKLLQRQKRLKDEKVWLSYNEIDLLKKLYYLEKREKQDK